MSAFRVGGELVHYEVLGRGRTVVLIHGWLSSWRYWIPTMRQLQLRYRVYAVDLFGYGDSAKEPALFDLDNQVQLLDAFMEELGIEKAAFIAHGLGVQVLVKYARQHPERVVRMLLTSAPLFDPGDLDTRVPAGHQVLLTPSSTRHNRASETSNDGDQRRPLASKSGSQEIEYSSTAETIVRRPSGLEERLRSHSLSPQSQNSDQDAEGSPTSEATIVNPNLMDRDRLREAALARGNAIMRGEEKLNPPLEAVSNPKTQKNNPLRDILSAGLEGLLNRCFRRSDVEYEKLYSDLERISPEVVLRSADNFDAGKMLDAIRILPMPIIMVHGESDPIIPAPTEAIWNYLTVDKEDKLLPFPFPGSGHFPMMESDSYFRLLGSFLETQDVNKIEIKERWRRRTH